MLDMGFLASLEGAHADDPGGSDPGCPDVLPDWLIASSSALPEPLGCDCGCTGHDVIASPIQPELVVPQQDVPWATPGVTGLGLGGVAAADLLVLPPASPEVLALRAAIAGVDQAGSSSRPEVQALADAQVLLDLEQQLRVLNLTRIGDVAARGLYELVGVRGLKPWLRLHRPDGDTRDGALAAQLRGAPLLAAAVQDRSVSLTAARQVTGALRKTTAQLDRPGGLIDGQPGDLVLQAVVRHVLTVICRFHLGLADDDRRLPVLIERAKQVLAAGSQAAMVEAAFTWLAQELPASQLAGPLDELVVALLPTVLDEREADGHARRGLSLTAREDGTGWHVCGDLDLHTGEQLWAALRAEAARDPRNPSDTAAWAAQDRASTQDVWQGAADLAGGWDASLHPRNRRQRLHDALGRLLTRYLDHGLGGTHGKNPVQIHVTLFDTAVTDQPGAPPPRTDSGRLVPRDVVRRWWGDANVTSYVLSLGGKALRTVHHGRTLTGTERRALHAEGGDRCIGDGCCPGLPDPLIPLRPHHIFGYAENQITSLDDTLPACDTLHDDLHVGHKTVRLRNGRYLNEHGYVTEPNPLDVPPF